MRVLVLGRGLPGPGQPLLGIFEFQQARALAAAGHQVVYGALDIRFLQHRRPWGVRHKDVDGVHVVELSLPLGRLQYRLGYRFVHAMWEVLYLACVTKHGRPDVVHSHFVGWSAAAARGRRRHHYPLVVTEHTSRLMSPDPPADMLRGIAIAYAGADVLIAVSPGLQARIAELTGYRAVYVPNLVDAKTFASVEPIPHDRPRVVTVGNLIPRKRVDALLEAIARVSQEDPHSPVAAAELVVIGHGPQEGELRDLARRLGLADRVRFEGGLSHPQIAAEFARSDLFVLASREETFGVVLIEAMAAGLPVVSTRSGGPEGFVTEHTGVLTGHEIADIAAGLQAGLTRSWDREQIREYAVRHHSPEVVSAQLTELYGEAVARMRRRRSC
ncbi:D-inositol-3-phosphate glycosyltransferase [Austwickia sp. TVS 96-490-7B]|uniref:glycosyltransferase n=1 Tax=Austwickia sp. TVS 96-490-7B TaxID=2830843 RepID=UPI001C572225|nr:glycosyltransferase [Austwickia sp. TVS 96-490-7B]MBW3085877.1 D-inositol-3-phosphate glycosyltransferase [Austwickia sp. TVS 96-490-7B]